MANEVQRWYEDISARASVTADQVADVLRRYGLRPPAAPGRPHRLRVVRVAFAGHKPATDSQSNSFSFSWEPGDGVSAIATRGENEAGKSSVLEILRWAVRGRCQLQPDVRRWLEHVAVEFDVDDERIVIVFSSQDGVPSGGILRVGSSRPGVPVLPVDSPMASSPHERAVKMVDDNLAVWLSRFDSAGEMEEQVGELMLDRLGFEKLTGWQQVPEQIAAQPGDGSRAELGWPLWSAALGVGSLNSVIGEEPLNASRLLQVYLGTRWAGTAIDCRTALKALQQEGAASRRRASQDMDARGRKLARLRMDEERLLSELASMATHQGAIAAMDSAVRLVNDTSARLARAEAKLLEQASLLGSTLRTLEDADAELLALSEDRLARRFFQSITPTCCPRCDAAVDADRLRREAEGHCSLCNEEIREVPEPETISDDDVEGLADDLAPDAEEHELVRQREELRQLASSVSAAHDEALAERENARSARDAAEQALDSQAEGIPSLEQRHATETRLAVVRALIEEVGTAGDDDDGAAEDREILQAAYDATVNRRDSEQSELLAAVSERILDLAREFGLDEFESVKLNGAAQLRLKKGGGADSTYSKVTGGEQLRLKVATMIALLQVGQQWGVGRHPGLVIVDSVGAEEIAADDLGTMIQALKGLAGEQGPQILLASARGAELASLLESHELLLAAEGQKLW